MWVDSHCHLIFFPEDEIGMVIARARAAGVTRCLCISTTLDEVPQVIACAEAYDGVYASVGVHPHEAKEVPGFSTLEFWAQKPKVIALGETGLDYHYEHSPRDVQQESLRIHRDVGVALGMPLIIHSRGGEEDLVRILREAPLPSPHPGVIHCFSGTQDFAAAVLDLGFYISISGMITFKKADDLRQIVQTVPLDRLLLETDSPYLAPVPHRGKRNEPAMMIHIAEHVAELKNINLPELARITTQNFDRVFFSSNKSDLWL